MDDLPLYPFQVHVCFAFFEQIIFHPCCICLIFFVLYEIDMCYFMRESIEATMFEEHQIDVVGDPPLPPHVRVCLAFFEKFIVRPCSICLVFFVFADIEICYFMHESSEEMVLEEHQIQVFGNPPLPPKVHVYFAFFEKTIFRPCSICLIFFVLFDIDICYFMQASSEKGVLEEHQINVVGDPPLPP